MNFWTQGSSHFSKIVTHAHTALSAACTCTVYQVPMAKLSALSKHLPTYSFSSHETIVGTRSKDGREASYGGQE